MMEETRPIHRRREAATGGERRALAQQLHSLRKARRKRHAETPRNTTIGGALHGWRARTRGPKTLPPSYAHPSSLALVASSATQRAGIISPSAPKQARWSRALCVVASWVGGACRPSLCEHVVLAGSNKNATAPLGTELRRTPLIWLPSRSHGSSEGRRDELRTRIVLCARASTRRKRAFVLPLVCGCCGTTRCRAACSGYIHENGVFGEVVSHSIEATVREGQYHDMPHQCSHVDDVYEQRPEHSCATPTRYPHVFSHVASINHMCNR